MGFFELWEWWLFAVLNVAGISAAYFVLPAKLIIAARDEKRAVLPDTNARLFAGFIIACGVGHIAMPAVMWAGMSWMERELGAIICGLARLNRPQWVTFCIYVLLIISVITATVSWRAATSLRLKI